MQPKLLTFVGPAGSGTSTMARLVKKLCDPDDMGTIVVIDIGDLVSLGRKLNNSLGLEYKHYEKLREFPCLTMQHLLEVMMNRLRMEYPHFSVVIGSGFPFFPDHKRISCLFDKVFLVHMSADIDTARHLWMKRSVNSENGKSASIPGLGASFPESWDTYHEITRPMAESATPSFNINRKERLKPRLQQVMHWMAGIEESPIDKCVVSRSLDLLQRPDHPVVDEITLIESGRQMGIREAVASRLI